MPTWFLPVPPGLKISRSVSKPLTLPVITAEAFLITAVSNSISESPGMLTPARSVRVNLVLIVTTWSPSAGRVNVTSISLSFKVDLASTCASHLSFTRLAVKVRPVRSNAWNPGSVNVFLEDPLMVTSALESCVLAEVISKVKSTSVEPTLAVSSPSTPTSISRLSPSFFPSIEKCPFLIATELGRPGILRSGSAAWISRLSRILSLTDEVSFLNTAGSNEPLRGSLTSDTPILDKRSAISPEA